MDCDNNNNRLQQQKCAKRCTELTYYFKRSHTKQTNDKTVELKKVNCGNLIMMCALREVFLMQF